MFYSGLYILPASMHLNHPLYLLSPPSLPLPFLIGHYVYLNYVNTLQSAILFAQITNQTGPANAGPLSVVSDSDPILIRSAIPQIVQSWI